MIDGTITTIPDINVPLASLPIVQQWAPVNILFVVLGLLGCAFTVFRYCRSQRMIMLEAENGEPPMVVKGYEEHFRLNRNCFYLRMASVGIVTGSVFICALTQDISGAIVAFDLWTFVLGALFVTQMVLIVIAYRQSERLLAKDLDPKRISIHLS
jgi:hypothetical protein